MINILFTSVGRRVNLLRAYRNAYQSLNLDGHIVALDIDPLAPALQIADKPYIVPRLDSPGYIPTLIEICEREKVNVIFPLIDPDIPILANHRASIEATGARLSVVDLEAVNITSDKWQTYKFFQGLQLPTPASWLPNNIDPEQASYPLFVKPRYGSAAKNTFKVSRAEELTFFTKYVPAPIIQEYMSGPEITNDIVCDLNQEVLAIVSRQRIEVRWGEVAKGVTIYDKVITEACLKIAQALPAIGPITVQCMLNEGIPHFTEINARLGGGVPLGIAAGVDSPRWLLARIAGIEEDIPPLDSYQTGLYITRFDDSFFLTEDNLEQIAGHRL